MRGGGLGGGGSAYSPERPTPDFDALTPLEKAIVDDYLKEKYGASANRSHQRRRAFESETLRQLHDGRRPGETRPYPDGAAHRVRPRPKPR